MSTTTKRPPLKQTVGAQHICFALNETDVFTAVYEADVEKTETVKSVSISENSESTPVLASGKIYDNMNSTASTEISVEVIAFSAATRAKMRGDIVTTLGLIKKGGSGKRPFFAYGKVVKYFGGALDLEWYPKCQLTANTDETKTKEDSYSEQNETLTITAMPFNDEGDISVVYSSDNKVIAGLNEEIFFTAPILDDADLEKLLTPDPASNSILQNDEKGVA